MFDLCLTACACCPAKLCKLYKEKGVGLRLHARRLSLFAPLNPLASPLCSAAGGGSGGHAHSVQREVWEWYGVRGGWGGPTSTESRQEERGEDGDIGGEIVAGSGVSRHVAL